MSGKVIHCLSVVALLLQPALGVSVLSHEEMVDFVWDSDIRPLLESRFPEASPEQMKRAHGFAYGGSVIQDIGYYPLGNQVFTNFLHYVRTGDFIAALIRDARDVNEYAFAPGGARPLRGRQLGSHGGEPRNPHSLPQAATKVWGLGHL